MTMPEYDPIYLEYRVNHRLALYRRAAIFVPAAVILSGLAIWSALGLPQTFVMVLLFGLFALAADAEAISTLRDLRSTPTTTVGRVGRSWNKGRFLVFGRVHYIMVQRKLFEIGPITARELDYGDEVTITHWPHTNSIITLKVSARAEQAAS